jgi:electron transfer flavoprotein alpha/beta subunit
MLGRLERQESLMKILVCMKQVPQKDAPLKLNEAGTWIREDLSYEVNEPDAYALEEALRQKEKHGGEVVVITSGPARSSVCRLGCLQHSSGLRGCDQG